MKNSVWQFYNIFLTKLKELINEYKKINFESKEELEVIYEFFSVIYGILKVIDFYLWPNFKNEILEELEEELDSLKVSIKNYDEFKQIINSVEEILKTNLSKKSDNL